MEWVLKRLMSLQQVVLSIIGCKVCVRECQSNKEKSRHREELISTLFSFCKRSDGYSYYVNDCSCVCRS